jgi:hypothetical protein
LLQHWQAMAYEAEIELYAGDGAAARRRLERDAQALGRSFLLKVQFLRARTYFARGRAAIASLDFVAAGERRARVAEAETMARKLASERAPYTGLFASMVSAAAANGLGDRAGAVSHLRAATELAKSAHMELHGAAALRRLGELLDGPEGRALVRRTDEAMAAKGVRAPAKIAGMFLPGRWAIPIER